MSNTYNYEAFQELSDIFQDIIGKVDNVMDVLEDGAKLFVNDLLKLPKPMSKIRKAGYTHLVNSFSYRRKSKEIETGWGKYYGSMVENGTIKMDARPHVYPVWKKKNEKYYKYMISKLGMNT